MTNTVVRIYDDFSNAESARDELLRAGFDTQRLHLEARDDGAVPVQGNFYVGDPGDSSRETHTGQGLGGFLKSLIDSDEEDYNGTFRHNAQSATYVLTIHAADKTEAAIICEITSRHGALPTDNGTCSETKENRL